MRFISNTAYFDRLEHVDGYSATLYDLSYFQHFLSADPNPFDVRDECDPRPAAYPSDPQFNRHRQRLRQHTARILPGC